MNKRKFFQKLMFGLICLPVAPKAIFTVSTSSFVLTPKSNDVLYIYSSGNLSLGTPSPNVKLNIILKELT